MNSSQWLALADRARALMCYGSYYSRAWCEASALHCSFVGQATAEEAREALLGQGAKPSVAAAAANSPYGGKFGSWSWYRQEDGGYSISSNRRRRGDPYADEAFQARRAANRLREACYASLLHEAADSVRAGAVLPWTDGNSGGVFMLLPLGGYGNERLVSAKGLAKRLGVQAPVCEGPRGYSYWGQASWEDRLAAASQAFTLAVVGPEIPDDEPVWQDPRARAAERAKRNTAPRKPRVDQKRARETRFLPTWKDVA